jgi:hypothetical protein
MVVVVAAMAAAVVMARAGPAKFERKWRDSRAPLKILSVGSDLEEVLGLVQRRRRRRRRRLHEIKGNAN